MMTVLMGKQAPETVARACDLGVAMQLSNIARDVGEDARAGRLYLPRSWLREEGVDPELWLADPNFTAEIGRVVRRLLAVADLLYTRADAGIGQLPLVCRPGIGAARLLYAEIGHEVLRHGGDSESRRAVVSGRRKLALLGRGAFGAVFPATINSSPPLPQTRFLVEAVLLANPRRVALSGMGRMLDLIGKLQARDAIPTKVASR